MPRKGWREEVEKYLQVLGVRRWRELVTDRTKWSDIVGQAKARSVLWRQRKKKKKNDAMKWKLNFLSRCLFYTYFRFTIK
jgi:hypothetical protein